MGNPAILNDEAFSKIGFAGENATWVQLLEFHRDLVLTLVKARNKEDDSEATDYHGIEKVAEQDINATRLGGFWFRQYVLAMEDEVRELKEKTPWKWWKKGDTLERSDALEELVDILHFWFSAALAIATPAEILDAYVAKAMTNVERATGEY